MNKEITYNDIKTDKKLNIITKVHAAKLESKEQFISYANGFFNLVQDNSIGFRKLNRNKNAKLFNEEDNIKKIERAEKCGYFRLEGFADCYRRTIKISYGTLRTRLVSKPLLLQYLIDNDYLIIYTKEQRTMIVVNYNKRFEFIELILKAFLNDHQRKSVLK